MIIFKYILVLDRLGALFKAETFQDIVQATKVSLGSTFSGKVIALTFKLEYKRIFVKLTLNYPPPGPSILG